MTQDERRRFTLRGDGLTSRRSRSLPTLSDRTPRWRDSSGTSPRSCGRPSRARSRGWRAAPREIVLDDDGVGAARLQFGRRHRSAIRTDERLLGRIPAGLGTARTVICREQSPTAQRPATLSWTRIFHVECLLEELRDGSARDAPLRADLLPSDRRLRDPQSRPLPDTPSTVAASAD